MPALSPKKQLCLKILSVDWHTAPVPKSAKILSCLYCHQHFQKSYQKTKIAEHLYIYQIHSKLWLEALSRVDTGCIGDQALNVVSSSCPHHKTISLEITLELLQVLYLPAIQLTKIYLKNCLQFQFCCLTPTSGCQESVINTEFPL